MATAQYAEIAPTLTLLNWNEANPANTLDLLQARANATFQAMTPTFGAEEFCVDISNMTAGGVMVVLLVRFGDDDGDAPVDAFPLCNMAIGALAAGLQRAALNELELTIAAGTRRTFYFANVHKYFSLGMYTDAAPGVGQVVGCRVHRRISGGVNQGGV